MSQDDTILIKKYPLSKKGMPELDKFGLKRQYQLFLAKRTSTYKITYKRTIHILRKM